MQKLIRVWEERGGAAYVDGLGLPGWVDGCFLGGGGVELLTLQDRRVDEGAGLLGPPRRSCPLIAKKVRL